MNDQNPPNFTIGTEDESPETLIREEIADRRLDKLGQKLTLISILIPCMLCIIIFLAYLDIKKRFVIVEGTGAREFKNLSENLESSNTSLSVQFAKLQESLAKQNDAFEKTTAGIENRLKKANKDLDNLKSKKADRKKLSTEISKIKKSFSKMDEELKQMSSSLESIQTQIKDEVAQLYEVTDQSNTEILKNKTSIVALAVDRIDQKKLDLALKAEQKNYQLNLSKASKELQKQIEYNLKKLKELEGQLKSAPTTAPVKTDPTATPEKPKPTVAAPPKPTGTPEKPQPGTIIEQDIE
ncbi:hypothetical protein ACFL9U_03840 [Thermodesulfobacteriota bacterium]